MSKKEKKRYPKGCLYMINRSKVLHLKANTLGRQSPY